MKGKKIFRKEDNKMITKDITFSIKLYTEQYYKIKEEAEKIGISMSEYVRRKIFEVK